MLFCEFFLSHVIWKLVFILFKFKKYPNISGIRVVDANKEP